MNAKNIYWTNYSCISLCLIWLDTYVKLCSLFGYVTSLHCAWAYTLKYWVYKEIFGDQKDELWVTAWFSSPVHLNCKQFHWSTYSFTSVKKLCLVGKLSFPVFALIFSKQALLLFACSSLPHDSFSSFAELQWKMQEIIWL